ncbi:MAG: hypothetical protein CVV23_10415 [Ignavibacteriae bacterium HGW-Ignavibacteriae-2]|jgi:hypothetical protein|nr:MAG: hypothetical protein CVV23_10415 [Ignavibacteriae bacterium HGW-Ignavibacteriae-2]
MFASKIKTALIICLIFGLPGKLFSQFSFQDETIAEIEGEKITASWFQELWEMSPHLNTGNKNNSLSEKINFLNTIIAYKLWYRNNSSYNVDTSSAYSTAIKEIEKMYVRDALYRQEILNRIKITPDELNRALKNQQSTLVVNYILSTKEDEIQNLFKLLESGYSFDSLLAERDESKLQPEPVQIKFGDYPEPVEDELYSLIPGTFSRIIQFSDGYYIFNLKNIIKKVWGGSEDQQKETQKAEDIIKKRKENMLFDSFMKKTLNGVKTDVNRSLYEKLKNELVNAFASKKVSEEKNSFITLSIDDFVGLQKRFSKHEINSPFVFFTDDTVRFGECIRALYFNGLRMPSPEAEVIIKTFDVYIRNFIEMEVLYKEGLKSGIKYSHAVQKYIKMWSEFYSFETIRGGMIDTVNIAQEKIKNAYDNIYKGITENTFYKFDYACFSDSAASKSEYQKIMSGFGFDSLVKQKGSRIENAFFSDRNKWVPVSDCGKYKTKLLEQEAGGILLINDFDSLSVLVKIVDKKTSKEILGFKSYEDSFRELKKRLALEEINNQITQKTAEYAAGSKVKINYDALKRIDLTNISSMTVRFMGFGGSISGVPVYTPNYEWTELLDSKMLLP